MRHKIHANTLLETRCLIIEDASMRFRQSVGLGGERRFSYGEIDCVLMSPESVLSFQVGQEVFSLPLRLEKPKHQAALAAFLGQLRQTQAPAA
jgi:hypothetical protein